MNAEAELEANLQLQASSPAQNNQSEGSQQAKNQRGEQHSEVTNGSEHNEGEQAIVSNEVSKPGAHSAPTGEQWGEQSIRSSEQVVALNGADKSGAHSMPMGEQRGEQSIKGYESNDRQQVTTRPESKDHVIDEHSALEGEQHSEVTAGSEQSGGEQMAASNGLSQSGAHPAPAGEQKGKPQDDRDIEDCEAEGEQPLPTSQWLKSILPEASNGWWDIRDKSNTVAVMFRWRDPDLQVITPLRVTSEQFETLRQSEDAKSRIREQISIRLHTLSLDPAKRDKALVAAARLGIDLSGPAVHSLISKEI